MRRGPPPGSPHTSSSASAPGGPFGSDKPPRSSPGARRSSYRRSSRSRRPVHSAADRGARGTRDPTRGAGRITSLQFECPTTSKPLPPMLMGADSPEARIAVHCPKCSQLHLFSASDAVAEGEVAVA